MPGFQGDYSNDYQWWDNTEAVAVSLLRPDPANPVPPVALATTVSISMAFRGDIDGKATEYLGVSTEQFEQIWTIPTALLTTNELRIGDTITDADEVVWVIQAATKVMLGTSDLFWTVATSKRESE